MGAEETDSKEADEEGAAVGDAKAIASAEEN